MLGTNGRCHGILGMRRRQRRRPRVLFGGPFSFRNPDVRQVTSRSRFRSVQWQNEVPPLLCRASPEKYFSSRRCLDPARRCRLHTLSAGSLGHRGSSRRPRTKKPLESDGEPFPRANERGIPVTVNGECSVLLSRRNVWASLERRSLAGLLRCPETPAPLPDETRAIFLSNSGSVHRMQHKGCPALSRRRKMAVWGPRLELRATLGRLPTRQVRGRMRQHERGPRGARTPAHQAFRASFRGGRRRSARTEGVQ